MAVRIRLSRVGAKKSPAYRIVVSDSRSPRDGRFIDILGHYNPTRQPSEFDVDVDKVKDWIAKGAKPSDTVRSLLKKAGVYGNDNTVEESTEEAQASAKQA